MGLIHGQLSPQSIDEDGIEYLHSGPIDMNKGWTVADGSSPQLDLNLQSHYLITGISLRACTGKQCPLPTVFQVVMWNNSDSWIYFKSKTKDGIYSVGGCVFSILFIYRALLVGWWASVNGTCS